MPQWVVNLLVSLAIRALEYFQNRLSSEHCDRLSCVLPPVTGVAGQVSSMPDRHNPALANDPAHGGIPK